MTRIIELIYTDECVVGKGTEDSPTRTIQQLFTKGGSRVAWSDPLDKNNHLVNAEILRAVAMGHDV